MEAAEAPAHVWVVDAGDTELDRSERVARRARRQGAEVRALGSRWCVALPEGFDEVQVSVGTSSWARALVTRLVLMYTTCSVCGGRERSQSK